MKLSEVKNIFNLKLCLILFFSSILCLWAVYKLTFTYITNSAFDDIQGVLLDHRGIHRYVQGILIPSYFKAQEEGYIDKQWYSPVMLSSSYIIRNQHDFYNEEREKEGLPSIYYKLASLNPRNPVNKADEHEKELIEMFRKNPGLTKDVHITKEDGQLYYHVSIPFLRNKTQCLRCHGNREDAPPDLQELYPGEGGFNEKLGDLRAITALKVPMEDQNLILFVVLVVCGIMLLSVSTLIIINLYMRRQVDKEIKAHKVAMLEKQQLEVRLTQAQKMEAVGTLAGGIAHDFNNILAVILGYTDMAKEDAPPGSKYATDLDKVLIAGNRAKDLVKQILAFSRQTEVQRIPLQLQPLVKEAVKMLRASIPTTIEIQENVDPSCGQVLADPTQVHQIIMNLCTNANHAMERFGGILKIELRRVDLRKDAPEIEITLEPGLYIELIVSDTGSGIGPDVIEKIFDPYFTSKEPGKGTGMGLAIIHGIISEYGGAITVESELGKGTTFHVYFPTVDKGEIETVVEGEEVTTGKGRILFIDDEDMLAEMGKEMLERLGYDVTVRQSSIDALTTFQNNPDAFDVVITDQTMPGMTGADLSRRIMQIRPEIPIILCTGYSNLVDEFSAKSIGIKEFAFKPLTKGTIAKLLQKILETEKS